MLSILSWVKTSNNLGKGQSSKVLCFSILQLIIIVFPFSNFLVLFLSFFYFFISLEIYCLSIFILNRLVYQKYCDAMNDLSEVIMELLAISLGVDRKHYLRFFEDAESMMRCNFYPPCSANLTGALGNGPHCDPISITILLQDQVGGLEVFADNKWLAVPPKPDTFVINIGDTFMVCKW